MKFAILISLVNLLSVSCAANDVNDLNIRGRHPHILQDLFEKWILKHEKVYESIEEEKNRFKIWKDSNFFIEQHNNKIPKLSYTLAHNEYSDLLPIEFRQRFKLGEFSPGVPSSVNDKILNRQKDGHESTSRKLKTLVELPEEVDWVAAGAVTGVKDQGSCGSCWAFSAIGAIESAKFLGSTHELVSLSEQHLIDCDHSDKGCNGGLMDNAFGWDEKHEGVCSEEDYPYVMRKHFLCQQRKCSVVAGTKVSNFVDVEPNDRSLREALTKQPISVAIESHQQVFQFYSSGVFDSASCGSDVDHGVLMVGYGTEDGKDYYKIKNSWGTSWGEDGYIKFTRDSSDPNGQCGVYSIVSYPETNK